MQAVTSFAARPSAGQTIDPRTDRKLHDAAKDYESVFISQMVSHMFDGVKADSMFGGGQAEDMYKSLLTEQYAKSISAKGGVGLAQPVYQEMLKIQEHAQGGSQ